MRLLFVSNYYPPETVGGLELRCAETAGALRDRGHEVWVVTARPGRAHDVGAGHDPRVLRTLALDADRDHYRPGDFVARPARQRRNRRALAAALATARPDVVLVWGMWNLSRQVPLWLEHAAPHRVAYMIASYWPSEQEAHRRYWDLPADRSWLRAPKRLAGRLLAPPGDNGSTPAPRFEHARCVSPFVRHRLVAAGALPASAGVLLAGIDPTPWVGLPAPDWEAPRWRLLYCGRLADEKGVGDAIDALARLRELAPERRFELALVGGGHPTVERALAERVSRLGLGDGVVFAGAVPRAEVPAWMGRSELFVFPSVWDEPLARAPLEAMAAGRLVIGTTVGGTPEFLDDGVNALAFPAGDADALAHRIADASRDPEQCRRLAAAGRRTVLERFTLARHLDELEHWLAAVDAAARRRAATHPEAAP